MPSSVRTDLAAVRKLASERVEESSLRAVAEQIGISKSGLAAFLAGADPYSRTQSRLVAWYMRRHLAGRNIETPDVDAAIAVLTSYIEAAGSEAAKEKRARKVSERLFGLASR